MLRLALGLTVVSTAGASETAPRPPADHGVEQSAPASFEALMAHFASSGGIRAEFEETRRITILEDPILSRGTLYFAPPRRLARVTTSPGSSTIVVQGARVVMVDETGRREMDLSSSDVASTIIGNLMVLLRGDVDRIRERYSHRYRADHASWLLVLEPLDEGLGSVIERIRLSGRGRALVSMETVESNGDRTTLAFLEVETGVRFDDDAGPFSLLTNREER